MNEDESILTFVLFCLTICMIFLAFRVGEITAYHDIEKEQRDRWIRRMVKEAKERPPEPETSVKE